MSLNIPNRLGASINPELIGLFFEDINFAADGGLYAEMIENRSFEAKEAFGTPGYFYAVDDYGYAWSAYSSTGALPRLQYVSGCPLASENPHYLRITATEEGQGFSNKAYDGIVLKKGLRYNISFYARPVTFTGDSVTVRILKNGHICGEVTTDILPVAPYMPFSDMANPGELHPDTNPWDAKIVEARSYDHSKYLRQNEWHKYELTFVAEEDTCGADFVILLNGTGSMEFDFISMIPGDAVCGVFRKDLFDALKDLNPGFIRFPGGCIIEGISLDNRYPWKDTLKPVIHRRYISNLWGFQDDRFVTEIDAQRADAHYGQSFGIGFYEYFLLCELLNAKPLPVLNVGLACQFRSTELVSVDSQEFKEYVQDALDLVEFANGSADTKWGSIRASLGHPEPFNLTMIGIGNEQWETKFVDFYTRYDIFEKALHEKYPDLKLIGSAGPALDKGSWEESWEIYRNKAKRNPNYCFASDEHYYVSPEWLYDHYDFYDNYPRSVGVFAGEYAGHPSDRENTMVGALAEAALLCGLEKNADVIKLASYAPLFNRIGHSQWKPDMIWFDDKEVFVTPSYQVQKLFANNLGETIIPLNGQEIALKQENIYVSLTQASSGEKILKVVNARENDYHLALNNENNEPLFTTATVQRLASAGDRPADHPEPSIIIEESVDIQGAIILKARQFYVIRFH